VSLAAVVRQEQAQSATLAVVVAEAQAASSRRPWSTLWTFSRVDSVEPTNNAAERAIRPAVLWRKGRFGSDSDAGSRVAERLLTVVASCRQQGRSLLAFPGAAGEAALRGRPPPSLVAAPRGH
jgi:transposase